MSGGAPETVRGLGLLEGSLSVHLDGEAERLPVYRAAVADGELPPGYAADDGAALVYVGTRLFECVASRPGARVVRYQPDGHAGVIETRTPDPACCPRPTAAPAGSTTSAPFPSSGRCGPGATAGTDRPGEETCARPVDGDVSSSRPGCVSSYAARLRELERSSRTEFQKAARIVRP